MPIYDGLPDTEIPTYIINTSSSYMPTSSFPQYTTTTIPNSTNAGINTNDGTFYTNGSGIGASATNIWTSQWQVLQKYPLTIIIEGINYVPRVQIDGTLKLVPENSPVQAEVKSEEEEKVPFVYVDRSEMHLEIERYE